jgi:TolB-like protein
VAGFANITGRAEDDWLGTGLSETVAAALQEIEGLEVWGRERLREGLRRLDAEASEVGPEDAAKLGRMVGARWVLGGGVQRLGDLVRVTARVVEVESGRVLRAVKMDGRILDLFELQDRIVAELAADSGKRRRRQRRGRTQVVKAYEALAEGLLNMRADTYEALDRATLFFERALALDPDYIRAQVELGYAWAQKGEYLSAPEFYERAITILRRTLEARPRLPRAWRELGVTLVAAGRVDEGLEALRRAHSLAPEDPRVLSGLARGYFIGRRTSSGRALRQGGGAQPGGGWYLMQLAHCYALLREYAPGAGGAARHRAPGGVPPANKVQL